jgi:hypothetical protein
MSQIRVDRTTVKRPQETLLRALLQEIANEHKGTLGTEALGYYKNVIKSDIDLAYFDDVITRGIAVNTKDGLTYAGDSYGYIEPYQNRTDEITHRYLDREIEGALRDNQFAVLRQPTGKNAMQFTGTDLSGKQLLVIRDSQGKVRVTANGYAGTECQQPIDAFIRALATRGIDTETESVQPKSEERWLEQTILVSENN